MIHTTNSTPCRRAWQALHHKFTLFSAVVALAVGWPANAFSQEAPSFLDFSASPSPACHGTSVTIVFESSEDLQANPTVMVNGHLASYVSGPDLAYDYNSWNMYTYSYVLQTSDADGPTTISVSGTDWDGNTGSTSDTSALYVENFAPTFSKFSASPAPASWGTLVTISFTADQYVESEPWVSVNGHDAFYMSGPSADGGYSYIYTLDSSDPDGPAVISVTGWRPDGLPGTSNDSAALLVDNFRPTFANFSAGPTPAALNTPVTIQFMPTQYVEGEPWVTVNGRAASYVSGPDEYGYYSYSYTTQQADPDGPALISVTGSRPDGLSGTSCDSVALTIDKTIPYFSAFSASPSPACWGTTVTVSFEAWEILGDTPTVTINGHPATYIVGPEFNSTLTALFSYTYGYTLQPTDPDGPAVISVTVTRPDGVVRTTQNSTVLSVENLAPTFSSFSASPAPARWGTPVTIMFRADQYVEGNPSVTVNGHTATYMSGPAADGSYKYAYTVQTSDPYGPALITVTGSRPDGLVGSSSDSAALLVDNNRPTFQPFSATPSTATVGTPVNITFTADQPLGANPAVTVNGHQASYVSGGSNNNLTYTYAYTVQASDPDGPATIVVTGTRPYGLSGTCHCTTALTIDRTVPTVSFAFDNSSLTEFAPYTFVEVRLSGATSQTVTVNFSVWGTATGNGVDYQISGNSLTFQPGQTSKTIPVTIQDDSLIEGNETVTFTILSATNAIISSPKVHTLTIEDNDTPWNDRAQGAYGIWPRMEAGSCTTIYGQLLKDATPSSYQSSLCAEGQKADVWYYVTTFPGMKITATYWPQAEGSVSLWSGPNADQLTERDCSMCTQNGQSCSATYEAASGESDIWIRISSAQPNNTVWLSVCESLDCTELGTTNDVCSHATPIACSTGPVIGPLTVGATASYGQPEALQVPDVWYSLNMDTTFNPAVTISYDDKSTTAPGFVALYSGQCGNLALRAFSTARDTDGTFKIIAHPAGQWDTYYVRVGSTSQATDQQLEVSCFDKTNP